jgi:hypothetical protein
VALDGVGQRGGLAGGEAAGAGDPRDLAQPVAEQVGGRGIEPGTIGELEHPRAAELGELLLQAHPRQQVRDPLPDPQGGIPVGGGGGRGAFVAGHRGGTPVDWRTMRRVGSVTC